MKEVEKICRPVINEKILWRIYIIIMINIIFFLMLVTAVIHFWNSAKNKSIKVTGSKKKI